MSIEFKQATLANGLNIIAEVDPHAHTSGIGFFVKTGARDEATDVMGVSHFLEHMMFKGTEKRTTEQVDRDFDNLGATHNAFTSAEVTAFWAHMLPEHLPAATDVLADILRPALREEDFEDEKSVILEEIAMYEDQPFWPLYEQAMEAYYETHPLRHRVLGTNDSINALRCDQMAAYFNERYSADNTVVAMAGNLDFGAMHALLGEMCGHWNTTKPGRKHPSFDVSPGELTLTSDRINRHYLLGICPAPSIGDERRYAAGILAQILGDSVGSRLYWALVETGLAEEAMSQWDGRDGVGEFLYFACCSPENAQEVEGVIMSEIDGLVDSLTEDDLLRVRSKMATAKTLAGERPAGRMQRLGMRHTYMGEYMSLEEELERINAVDLAALREVAEAYPMKPVLMARRMPG